MKYIEEDERYYVDTEERDLEGDPILVEAAKGFGGCDIIIGMHTMTWSQVDALKRAITKAEEKWREK